jgi:hypothetical protein
MTFSEEKTDGVPVHGISGKIHLYLSREPKAFDSEDVFGPLSATVSCWRALPAQPN